MTAATWGEGRKAGIKRKLKYDPFSGLSALSLPSPSTTVIARTLRHVTERTWQSHERQELNNLGIGPLFCPFHVLSLFTSDRRYRFLPKNQDTMWK
jgi:hypothetical protein